MHKQWAVLVKSVINNDVEWQTARQGIIAKKFIIELKASNHSDQTLLEKRINMIYCVAYVVCGSGYILSLKLFKKCSLLKKRCIILSVYVWFISKHVAIINT